MRSESRPLPEEPRPVPGRGPAGAPTGPGGWVRGWADAPGTTRRGRSQPQTPPTPAPARGFRGPLRWVWVCSLARELAGYGTGTRYYPPGIPTSIPPPGTHPAPTDMHTAADRDQYGTAGTCTYDRFEDHVGEPRGVEHSHVPGPGTGYIQLFTDIRVYTAV